MPAISMFSLPAIEFLVAISLFVTCVVEQEIALHVCAEPDAAAVDIVYPASHALQSMVGMSHNEAPVPDAIVGDPLGHVHMLAVQDNVLN